MNLSQLISSGPLSRPQRVVFYGPHGIGKTFLAKDAPEALFLDLEDGTANFDLRRIRCAGWGELETALKTLRSDHEGVGTLVIDTVDAADKFLRADLCATHKKTGLEDFGYGKGWQYLLEAFEKFLAQLDAFISMGIHVVLVGHSTVKRVYLPELSDPFDRYELQIFDRNSARLRQWADAVLFLNWFTKVREDASGKVRGTGGRERVIYTTHSVAYDAKNRVNLPEKLECKFSELTPIFSFKGEPETPGDESLSSLVSVQERLSEALHGLPEDWVNGFLVDRKQIKEGQTIHDAPKEYCERALKRVTLFRQSIQKFGEEHEHVAVAQ